MLAMQQWAVTAPREKGRRSENRRHQLWVWAVGRRWEGAWWRGEVALVSDCGQNLGISLMHTHAHRGGVRGKASTKQLQYCKGKSIKDNVTHNTDDTHAYIQTPTATHTHQRC